MFTLPNGLSPKLAVLTEPLAVGRHAVRRAEVRRSDVAIMIGCGPVGLAVICMLKAQGVAAVVASDFSDGRRQLAAACGADIVVDPGGESPYEAPGDRGFLRSLPAAVGLAIGTMEKLRPMPVPWQHVWRIGRAGREAEAPGDLRVRRRSRHPGRHHRERAAVLARRGRRGLHEPDTIRPMMAVNKEIDLRFVMGYTPLEFSAHCTWSRGQGGGSTNRDGDGRAARRRGRLRHAGCPEKHTKIIIEPSTLGHRAHRFLR